ncbi:MAG: dCTP deaminase [Candidatus Magasanikbacteria bacterium]
MILSDRDIKEEMDEGNIVIDPFNEENLQPASYDLHLDKHFLVFDEIQHHVIDPKQNLDDKMKEVEIDEDDAFIIHPNEFALGMVKEVTGVSDKIAGRLEGKSSVGRLGLLIHVTAGFLDPGNELKLTLELHNTAPMPIKLYYNMPIAQIAFEKLSDSCSDPYSEGREEDKYYGDMKPKASQMFKNFDEDQGWV